MKRLCQNWNLDSLGVCVLVMVISLSISCSHSFLKYDKVETLEKNDEFANIVKIEEAQDSGEAKTVPPLASPKNKISKQNSESGNQVTIKSKLLNKSNNKTVVQLKKVKNKKISPVEPVVENILVRQPELENNEGFQPGSRRPLVDPFQRGEVVTHSVKYFKVSAGELKFKVEPFAQVNGKKAYTFAIEILSSSLFSAFYSAVDRVVTLVDFDQLFPRTFALHVKESGQLREARSFFDFEKNQATYWEKKVTEKSGEEEKKQQWEILPFTQNVFSSLFYMRIFKWEVGKEYAFRVADDEKNLIFKGKAIRKEKLSTALGEMDAIVVKPEIILEGAFTPVGDIYIWLSDDEHKYILRIESKIKIGTLVSEVVNIEPGRP